MAFVSVLKYEGDNTTFIWRHPTRNFNTGSQLIVHESQEAIFMVNGEALDSFGPGRHTLETENLPLLRSLLKLSTGGRNVFRAELYFANLTEQMAIRWGTDSKIDYLDPVYDFPLEIGACGEMSLSVSNARTLLVKLVGTEKNLTQEQLAKYFRAFMMTRAKSIIAQTIQEKRLSVFELDMHLDELSEAVKKTLADDFLDYGVALNSFLITTILKPDEDRNYLKFKDVYFRQKSDLMEAELQQRLTLIEQRTKAESTVLAGEAAARARELGGYTYQEEKSFEVAKEVANNEAIGQFANVGVGLGMISGVGGEIGKTVGGIAASAVKATVPADGGASAFCPNCGQKLIPGMRFCGYCGTKVTGAANASCPQCGYIFEENVNFCPQCGTKRE